MEIFFNCDQAQHVTSHLHQLFRKTQRQITVILMYEIILRLFGVGIASTIQFLPFSVDYNATDPSLAVAATAHLASYN